MDSHFKGTVGQDSSVGIGTHYKMDGLGLVGIFSACVQPVLGTTQPPEPGVPVFFARSKVARHSVDHPPLSMNPAKGRVPALPLLHLHGLLEGKILLRFQCNLLPLQ